MKNLYRTSCMVSIKHNTGFVPLPLKDIKNTQDLIDYSNKLNHFIRHPEFAYMDKHCIRNKIDRYYTNFPENIINLNLNKS